MTTVQVKPAPGLSPEAARAITHPASGGLLDLEGTAPKGGRPWLYDGFTCRLLTDGTIALVEDKPAPEQTGSIPDPVVDKTPFDLKTSTPVVPSAPSSDKAPVQSR